MLTRGGDYDLSDPNAAKRKRSDFNNRIKMINENNPDIYLSLHMNFINNTKYSGSQAFYSDVNKKNELLAKILQQHFNAYFNHEIEYTKIGKDKYMFPELIPPGGLIEYGFLSSAIDRENLKKEEYREELSEVIASALIEYFS